MPLLEWMTQSAEPEEISRSGPLAIRPMVADANALISDVYYAAQFGHTALLDAARFGSGRLYTSTHIYAKVYERLPNAETGKRSGLLPEALRLWEQEYLGLIRFVDMRNVVFDDPRVDNVALRDDEDQRIASLAALLGPCHLLSQDAHLEGLGAGGSDWRPYARASRDAMVPAQATLAATVPVSLVGEGVSAGVRFLRARPDWALPALLFGVALVGLVAWRLSTVERKGWEALGNRIAEMADAAKPYLDRYKAARDMLHSGTVMPAAEGDALNRVAFALSISPRPLLASELSRHISHLDSLRLSPQRIGQILHRNSCFFHVGEGRWQVGYRAKSRGLSEAITEGER